MPKSNCHHASPFCDKTMYSYNSNNWKYEKKANISKLEELVNGNPVGALQEMCVIKTLQLPSYELIQVTGAQHKRWFTMSCKVMSYCEVGCGKTKKDAKKMSACKMYHVLRETFREPKELIHSDEEATEQEEEREEEEMPSGDSPKECYSDLKGMKKEIDTISKNMSFASRLIQFEMYLKQSDSEKLYELQKTSLSSVRFDCIKLLQQLAEELHFETTYIDVDEKSVNGEYQCMLQITTVPLVICFGTGRTTREAQMSAAFAAVGYLKITTRK